MPCADEPEDECGPQTVKYEYSMCNNNPKGVITAWKNQIKAEKRNEPLDLSPLPSSFVAETGRCTAIVGATMWRDTCEKLLPSASLKINASSGTEDIQPCFDYKFMRSPYEENDEEDKVCVIA